MVGKAMPWSVVQMTRVLSAKPLSRRAAKTRPILASRVRAASMYSAMSRRVSGVSGKGADGRT